MYCLKCFLPTLRKDCIDVRPIYYSVEVTEKGLVGWDNEARGTELGRLHLVNNRNEYRSNKISTPNRPFSVTSTGFDAYGSELYLLQWFLRGTNDKKHPSHKADGLGLPP